MPDALSDAELVRQRLAGLCEQRRQQRVAQGDLAERTRLAVNAAIDSGVPMTEIARLLGMDRSSVYRTYVEAA